VPVNQICWIRGYANSFYATISGMHTAFVPKSMRHFSYMLRSSSFLYALAKVHAVKMLGEASRGKHNYLSNGEAKSVAA